MLFLKFICCVSAIFLLCFCTFSKVWNNISSKMLYRCSCSPREDCLLNNLCLYQLKYHIAKMARVIQIKMKFHLNFALELGNHMTFVVYQVSLWWGLQSTVLALTLAELLDFSPDLERPLALHFMWDWDEEHPEPALLQVLVQVLGNRGEGLVESLFPSTPFKSRSNSSSMT